MPAPNLKPETRPAAAPSSALNFPSQPLNDRSTLAPTSLTPRHNSHLRHHLQYRQKNSTPDFSAPLPYAHTLTPCHHFPPLMTNHQRPMTIPASCRFARP